MAKKEKDKVEEIKDKDAKAQALIRFQKVLIDMCMIPPQWRALLRQDCGRLIINR